MKTWMLVVLAGCALTSKSAPIELRYFTPLPPAPAAHPVVPGVAHARLRLGRITPSAHLRYPIVHRDSPVELAPYETLRWSEPPDAYVRRALGRALFEARPIDQAIGGAAPTLDVEVVAFEEVRHEARHSGRVELRYVLHDERAVLARGVVAIERDAAGPAIEQVVAAISSALDAAVTQLADRVGAVLSPT
ncbi:MAG: ABC-type transport auxiliary lipoprotein family protein [Acidobacteriota bacterium]